MRSQTLFVLEVFGLGRSAVTRVSEPNVDLPVGTRASSATARTLSSRVISAASPTLPTDEGHPIDRVGLDVGDHHSRPFGSEPVHERLADPL